MKSWLLFLVFFVGISIAIQPVSFAQYPAENDHFSKGLALDGSGDYVEVPDADLLNFGTETGFTVELWLNRRSSSEFDIIKKGNSWGVSVGSRSFDNTLYAGAIVVNFGNHSWAIITNSGPRRDEWYHLAITVDRSLNQTRIYGDRGDATLRHTYEDVPSNTHDMNALGVPLTIGGTPNSLSRWFNGDIDEVRIWNRVRSEDQILATKDAPLDPTYFATPDSGLVLYYRFDEKEDLGIGGQGADIRDLCPAGNHGVLRGDAAVPVEILDVPDAFALLQNYPNPFNPSTTIRFALPSPSFVTLTIYDLLGKEVETLVQQRHVAGQYEAQWNAEGLPSGMYFYRLEAGDYVATRPLILQK